MASLPPHPASQRRSSPREQEPTSSNNQSQNERTNSESFSATSEDSHTLLLNRRQSSRSANGTEQPHAKPTTAAPQPQTTQTDDEPRKCWICFNDETEDDPMSSEWRSPCPCVLVAHETCLLDWIADMEAPNSRRKAGGSAKVLCPQCKSEIKVVRPKSMIVDGVRAVERVTGMFLVPGLLVMLGSAAYSTATFLGTHTVYEIFGVEDGYRILAPLYEAPNPAEGLGLLRLFNHLRNHWRLDIGLPLIPSVLIASRTSMVDSFLPFIPLTFFISLDVREEMLGVRAWPPSAALTISLLPYLRGAYNTYYERVWLPREQKWLKEIQPRAGESDAGNELEDNADGGEEGHLHFEDDELELDLDVDFNIFRDWDNGEGNEEDNDAAEAPQVPRAPREPAPPLNAPPLDDDAVLPPPPNVPAMIGNAPPPPPQRVRRERTFTTGSLADTVLGALIFPSIAAAVGEALKIALPKSWVTLPRYGRQTGFLQSKWGRSIVGGCLFVGVKDAVMLYVRWKMAQNHRKRRVLDYQGKKGFKKGEAGKA